MRQLNAVKRIFLGVFRIWHGEASAMPADQTGGNNHGFQRQDGSGHPDISLPWGIDLA
jgi:hypothetical protein